MYFVPTALREMVKVEMDTSAQENCRIKKTYLLQPGYKNLKGVKNIRIGTDVYVMIRDNVYNQTCGNSRNCIHNIFVHIFLGILGVSNTFSLKVCALKDIFYRY